MFSTKVLVNIQNIFPASFHFMLKKCLNKNTLLKNNLEILQEKNHQFFYFLNFFKTYGGVQKNFLIALSNDKNELHQGGRKNMLSNIQERNVNYQSNNKNALFLSACNGEIFQCNQPSRLWSQLLCWKI